MKRVVVTGIGVVSCLGNNQEEIYQSLLNSKSGITFSEEYKEFNLKSHVHGVPNIKLEDYVDRKVIRFMGPGSAYNYIAMKEAVKDSGLAEKDVSAMGIDVSRFLQYKNFHLNILRKDGYSMLDIMYRRPTHWEWFSNKRILRKILIFVQYGAKFQAIENPHFPAYFQNCLLETIKYAQQEREIIAHIIHSKSAFVNNHEEHINIQNLILEHINGLENLMKMKNQYCSSNNLTITNF